MITADPLTSLRVGGMSAFTVVYQFLCPNCNHIGVGKFVFHANDAGEASHMLSAIDVPCRVCHQTVMVEASAKTLVFTATDQDLSGSGTGPADPRT